MNEEGFFDYARARHCIYQNRQNGFPREQWAQDPILQKYRFCNVFRELDRVTIWFRENVRAALSPTDYVGHLRAAVIFRYLNRIETGEAIKDLLTSVPSSRDRVLSLRDLLEALEATLRARIAAGLPILNGAYMIKTPLREDKVTGLLNIWRRLLASEDIFVRKMLQEQTLEAAVRELAEGYYVGPFMAYEIVTDLRHTPLLSGATDIMSWANPGPGAMRGASRVLGLPAAELNRGNKTHVARVMNVMLALLHSSRDPFFWPTSWGAWEMREVEHNLCEFDKYERARLGEGAPKQLYRGEAK